MKSLATAIFLAATTPCMAVEIEELSAGAAAPSCVIEIAFLTRCCGIDFETFDRVKRYIEKSKTVARAYSTPATALGETTFCLAITDERQATAIFEELTVLVPTKGRRLPKLKPPPPVALHYHR